MQVDFVNRNHLYKQMSHTYILPKKTCSFVTIEYLSMVYSRKVYAPEYTTCIMRNCMKKPPKEYVLGEVNRLLTQRNTTIGDTRKGLPDMEFLLTCLSTLDSDHAVFSRDYIPPPRKNAVAAPKVKFTDPRGLFAGMIPPKNGRRRRNTRTNNRFAQFVH